MAATLDMARDPLGVSGESRQEELLPKTLSTGRFVTVLVNGEQ